MLLNPSQAHCDLAQLLLLLLLLLTLLMLGQ